MSLNNISVDYAAFGRREDALAASEEAVTIRRQLAAQYPDAFQPDLARSINVMSDALAALERHQDAAKAADDALRVITPYLERFPARYSGLAAAIANDLLNYSEAANIEPDLELLTHVAEIIQQHTPDNPSA